MATIKNFGIVGIGQTVQFGKGGGKVVYDTGNSLFKVTTDGTTLGNMNVATPTADDHAANKGYVDSVAQGLDVKGSVRAATLTAITISAPGTQIDGVALTSGDRVLVKNQGTASENGIYVWTTSVAAMTRATDMDAAGEFAGAFFFVEEGSVNSDQGFVCTSDGTVTPGTDAVTFAQFTGTGQISAGQGLSKVGNTISANVDDTFIKIDANDAFTIKGTATTGQVLKSDGAGGVAYGTVNLASTDAVAGVLALTNGGLGVSVIDAASKLQARTNLGLDDMSTQNAAAVAITGGDIGASVTYNFVDDSISGDKISGGVIDNATLTGGVGKTLGGYDITVGALKTLDVDGVLDVDGAAGSAIDGVAIGGTTSAAGRFSTLTTASSAISGGAIDATVIGGVTPAAGTFTAMHTTTAKMDTVTSKTAAGTITFNSPINAAAGIEVASIEAPTVTTDSIVELTPGNGVAVDGVSMLDSGVIATGSSVLTTAQIITADIDGGTIDATAIGGVTSAVGTFSTLNSADAQITDGTVAANIDVTGKTFTVADNQISGDKIDGGTISDFASTGIDDNATAVKITVTDADTTIDNNLTVTGNLNVTGTLTSINTANTTISDNVIVLNDGETGAGVTAGSAGLSIDRGTEDAATFTWNETTDVFEFKVGAVLADLSVASLAMTGINVNTIGALTGDTISVTDILSGTDATFSGSVSADTISEVTTDAGVTVDSVLLKDGMVYGGLTAEAGDTVDVSAATNLVFADDQISGDAIEGGVIGSVEITSVDINGGTIDATAINASVIGGTTPAAGTFSDLNSANVNIDGGDIDGVDIGVSTSGIGTFSTLNSAGAAITGGAITGTSVGVGVANSAAGVFSTLNSAAATITGGSVTATLVSSAATLTGGSIDAMDIGVATSAIGTFSTLNSANAQITGGAISGVASIAVTAGGLLSSNNVAITGGSISGTSIDLTGQTLTLGADSISGNVIHSGIISEANLAGTATGGVGGAANAMSGYDITVGTGRTLDVSAGTLTLAANQISGDFVDGGTISDFASTGIDDNTTGTKLTISDATSTFANAITAGANAITGGLLTGTGAQINGNATITGDLTVSGSVTTINTETVTIADNIIVLNSNWADGDAAENAGLEVNRGSAANSKFIWDEATDRWSTDGADLQIGTLHSASFSLTGQVATTDGGTGTDTSAFADKSLMVMNAAGTAVTELAKGANSTVLKVNASGSLVYAKVDLTADVSGIAPIANGGTGLAVAGADHQILQSASGALAYGYAGDLRNVAGEFALTTSGMTSATNEYLDIANGANRITMTAKNASGTGLVDMYLQGQNGGDVFLVGNAGEAVLQGEDDNDLTVSGGNSALAEAGDLVLKGGNGTATFASGDVVLKGGNGGSSDGKVQVLGAQDTLIATFVETSASATDSLEIKNGTGGVTLEAVGGTNVNLTLSPKGTGEVVLTAGTDITGGTDMAVANKKYVDDEIAKVGDNFIRTSFTASSIAGFDVGAIKNVAGKTYYVARVSIKITTAFVGCDEIVISDGVTDLVTALDTDMSEAGFFIIDQGYETATAGGSTISATFGNGGTPVSPATGAVVIGVEYKQV